MATSQLYQRSSIGKALIDTLDDLITNGRIGPELAQKILANFDRSIVEKLGSDAKANMTLKGKLDTYATIDDVWTFMVKDVTFKMEDMVTIQAEKLKIVCVSTKLTTGEDSEPSGRGRGRGRGRRSRK